jgi:hypothetical protein
VVNQEISTKVFLKCSALPCYQMSRMIEIKILYQQTILKNIRKKTPNDNAIVVHKIKIELFKENKTQIMVWIF